jgi:acyl carrier protein
MDCITPTAADDLEKITECIRRVGKLDPIHPTTDMYSAGLRSIDALTLLMELEDLFGVSIPDDEFISARTPMALQELLTQLRTR